MLADCHTHVLPGIDDGPRNMQEAAELMALLKKQEVDLLLTTPHYYAHSQSVDEFLSARQVAIDALQQLDNVPMMIPAAEVYLEQGMHELDLQPLSFSESRCLLIEMPYTHYQGWMLQEVYHICLKQSLIPVFAHLNRYLSVYPSDVIEEILNFDNAVIQINHEALFQHRSLKTVLAWIKKGVPVLFGSDCHNTSSRMPDNSRALAVLKSKLGMDWIEETDLFQRQLLLGS